MWRSYAPLTVVAAAICFSYFVLPSPRSETWEILFVALRFGAIGFFSVTLGLLVLGLRVRKVSVDAKSVHWEGRFGGMLDLQWADVGRLEFAELPKGPLALLTRSPHIIMIGVFGKAGTLKVSMRPRADFGRVDGESLESAVFSQAREHGVEVKRVDYRDVRRWRGSNE